MWPSSVALGDRKQKFMSYIKQKRDEYLMNSDDDDEMFSGAVAGRSPTSSGSESNQPPPVLNSPFPNEQLTLYPAYSRIRRRPDGTNDMEVCLSGLLWIPGLQNRKNKLMIGLARQIAGVGTMDSAVGNEQQVSDSGSSQRSQSGGVVGSEVSILEEEVEQLESKLPGLFDSNTGKTTPTASTYNGGNTLNQSHTERILRERIAPFLARAAPHRQLEVRNESEYINKKVVSNNNGKFNDRVQVPMDQMNKIGDTLWVTANDELTVSVPILHIPPEGVSVISDIDDTCKNTGVTGVKREMFRNVFVRGYADLRVEAVDEWYNVLAKDGKCTFHYVSNSPYQLYPIIKEFLQDAALPQGTIHLKQYTGLINGLFEANVEKKRATLHGLLEDFPKRKFILIGDSGEADLEAYTELAINYPKQVIAIYIRDITSPLNKYPRNETARKESPYLNRASSEQSSSSKFAEDMPDLIDLSDSSSSKGHAISGISPPNLPPRPKTAPVVPKKPDYMKARKKLIGTPSIPKASGRLPAPVIEIPEDTPPDSPLIDWSIRVERANNMIPPHIQFSTWRTGYDLKTPSVQLVHSYMKR